MPKVTVDIAAIRRIQFGCVGCTTCQKCCCSSFEVCATEEEADRIVGLTHAVNDLRRRLDSPLIDGNVYDETEDGLLALDTDDDGLCVFAHEEDGLLRCSLHTVALELGLRPEAVKPLVCTLWPLAISGGRHKTITADAEAPGFHCVSRQPVNAGLCPAALETLEQILGTEAVEAVRAAAERGEAKVSVSTETRLAER
jgi:Fe-S-cluster containining protein